MGEEWLRKLGKVSVLNLEERRYLVEECGHEVVCLATFDAIVKDLVKFWAKKGNAEEEFLRKLREVPDGSFSKAWGYAMYGAMKAIESCKK